MLIALAPALVPGRRLKLAAIAVALVLGSWVALGASLATPGRVVTRLWDGTREFYDVDLPFDPASQPRMQGAVLLAIFAFCLLLALALAARRPLLAVLILAFGAGWPGTLVWGGSELLIGGLILAGALVILAGNRPRAKTALLPAAVAGALVVACCARPRLAPGRRQDRATALAGVGPVHEDERRVGVRYVWDSNYNGLDWPKKRTVVFTVEASDEPFYWRATTLDAFVRNNWSEDLRYDAALRDQRAPKRARAGPRLQKGLGQAEGDDGGAARQPSRRRGGAGRVFDAGHRRA